MPTSLGDIREKVARVAHFVSIVQLDLMDGVFVEPKTWPYEREENLHDIDTPAEEISLPRDSEVAYEIDLMVADPYTAAFTWVKAGAQRIIIHIESAERFGAFVEEWREYCTQFGVTDYGVPELGIALNTDTSEDAIAPFLRVADFVQCMGIATIGYQGNPFDERVIPKIRHLREAHPELIISVDGGVNFESAPRLIEAGANRLVSGSAIFNSDDIGAAINELGGSIANN